MSLAVMICSAMFVEDVVSSVSVAGVSYTQTPRADFKNGDQRGYEVTGGGGKSDVKGREMSVPHEAKRLVVDDVVAWCLRDVLET